MNLSTVAAMLDPNLLILSDLHLGEDIKPGIAIGTLRRLVRLERELCAFLAHYTAHRDDERPWRLVINGDMVDFLGVTVMPGPDDLGVGDEIENDEKTYGLGSHPRAAQKKLEYVLARHVEVFTRLAEFVAAGNHLDVVVGNHDTEFAWPLVQEAFFAGLERLVPDARLRERVAFHPWFYFEEGIAWVEHGHQYDAYCSFDYALAPATAVRPGTRAATKIGGNPGHDADAEAEAEADDAETDELALTMGNASMRYISNQEGGYQDGQELWTLSDYLKWAFGRGLGPALRLCRNFSTMCVRVIRGARRLRAPAAMARRKAHHRARLARLSQRFALGEDALDAIHAMHQQPIAAHLGAVLRALMLDRVILAMTAVVVVLGLVLALPWAWGAAASALVITVATLVAVRLGKMRESADPRPQMRDVTRKILKRVSARYVIFGHTHEAVAEQLDDGATYFNTGTWLDGDGEHQGRAAFTHVLIKRGKTAVKGVLCAWRGGRSEAIS
jgi:UDP-2,3-diacylglucosamine pyrophosphatase LpxH